MQRGARATPARVVAQENQPAVDNALAALDSAEIRAYRGGCTLAQIAPPVTACFNSILARLEDANNGNDNSTPATR